MKRVTSILLALLLVLPLAACGVTESGANTSAAEQNDNTEITSAGSDETTGTPATEASSESTEGTQRTDSRASDTLIVYFSESGNTDTIANYIHDEIGGDMVQIIPTVEYPHVYEELADYAKAEQDNDERPTFEELGVDPTSYQTVFIGYPIWWYSLPMIMETFFDTYDFSGVTIVPFNTHEGSRDGGTYDMIRDREPNAAVLDGLLIRGGDVGNDESKTAVKEWIAGLDLE
ncbi:MAG: flavodoxin [Clostridia bacterium]|nr:flavodoxin [Clostridia bacterium]